MTHSSHPVGLMPEGIKLSPPECFEGKHNRESVKEFIAALDIDFYLIGLKNDNTRELFSKIHLTKLARTWYNA